MTFQKFQRLGLLQDRRVEQARQAVTAAGAALERGQRAEAEQAARLAIAHSREISLKDDIRAAFSDGLHGDSARAYAACLTREIRATTLVRVDVQTAHDNTMQAKAQVASKRLALLSALHRAATLAEATRRLRRAELALREIKEQVELDDATSERFALSVVRKKTEQAHEQ